MTQVFFIVSTMSGLRPGVQYWLCSNINMLLIGAFCEVFATYVGIGSFDEQTASTVYDSVFNVLLLPCTGVLIDSHAIEYPMKAVAYANPLRLAVETEILNVFGDRHIITVRNEDARIYVIVPFIVRAFATENSHERTMSGMSLSS